MVATTTETLTSNTHLGTQCFVTLSRKYLNKTESSNYTRLISPFLANISLLPCRLRRLNQTFA